MKKTLSLCKQVLISQPTAESEVPTEIIECTTCFACNSELAPAEVEDAVDDWIQCDRFVSTTMIAAMHLLVSESFLRV